MAIDTRNERAGAIGYALPFLLLTPDPDAGAEDQADRQQLAYLFPGILAGSIVQATILGDLTTLFTSEYVVELKAASVNALDVDTLVENDWATVQATFTDDDRNTLYSIYLSST